MRNIHITNLVLIFLLVIISLVLPELSTFGEIIQAQDDELGNRYYLPIFQNNQEILTSTSYYLPTVDEDFLYELGCEHGLRDQIASGDQDSVVVLDFSYPICAADIGFGVALFEDDPYNHPTNPVPTQAVSSAVKSFAEGYYQCSGTDTTSNLVVGVGTNNKPTSCDTLERAYGHGQNWGEMISCLNQWALAQRIVHQVQFYAASNIEVSWSKPDWARAWLDGLEQQQDVLMLHFGDAAGCPYEEQPHWSCGPDWSVEDVWYVSWGASSALPLPLIYLTDGVHAKQWAYLSRYSVENHGYRIDFTGVFTQWQYCQQFSWCNGTDNSPEEAYQQMISELDKHPETSQSIKWKTDIRWIRETEIGHSAAEKKLSEFSPRIHPIYEEILKLEQALQNPGLSITLKTNLENKRSAYQALANMIEISLQDPAPKNR